MAGSNYYLLQQCGTANTAIGSSANPGLVGTFYYESIPNICWEVVSTDIGPIYTVDIDTLVGILDCTDPLCGAVPTPTQTAQETPTPTPTNPAGCITLTYQSSFFGTTCQGPNTYEQQTWRFEYTLGNVNQNVNIDYEYNQTDNCPGGISGTYTGSTTITSGSSYVDIFITASNYDDCGFGPPTCLSFTQSLT